MRERLTAIYNEHGAALISHAAAILRCRAAAEDAVHSVFVALCRLETPPAALVPYVFRAVRNKALEELRRGSRRLRTEREASSNGEAEYGSDASGHWPLAELREELQSVLQVLNVEEREVVALRHASDTTWEEIAAILEIPWKTAATRYRRALEKLSVAWNRRQLCIPGKSEGQRAALLRHSGNVSPEQQ